jgi:rhodanese-related sulfurtransferase
MVRILGGAALILGTLAAFVGSPGTQKTARINVRGLAQTVESSDDQLSAIELAVWLRDRRPNLRIIDLRDSAEYEDYHVPRAERISLGKLPDTRFAKDEIVVLYSGADGRAAQGWVFLRALGQGRTFFIRGGIDEWERQVMSPSIAPGAPPKEKAEFERVAEISRYFGGTPAIRERPLPMKEQMKRMQTTSSEPPRERRRRGC